MSTPSEKSVLDALTALVRGLERHAPDRPVILSSESYTKPQLIAEVRAVLASVSAVANAREALADALRNERETRTRSAEFLRRLRDTIQSMFLGDASTLADFGLTPRKGRRTATVEEALLTAQKRLATRKKRRTMGKRQRGAIKGVVEAVDPAQEPTK